MTANTIESPYEEAPVMGVDDVVGILKRRIWFLIVPSALISFVTIGIALLWPPTYRSEAIILIEQPAVPPNLVATTVTGYAEERVEAIKQRVLATENLVEIINKHNLFSKQRELASLHAVANAMRKKVFVNTISAGKRRRGATIAFTLAFEHGNGAVAQRVTNDLASLFLSENLRTRREKASETAEFLAAEARRLETAIGELEGQLADLKQQYAGSLPEQLQQNVVLVARVESELRSLDQREQAIRERIIYFETELAMLNPSASYPQRQLEALRRELTLLSMKYTPAHPDVLSLRRQIALLEKEVNEPRNSSNPHLDRDRLRTEHTVISETLGAEHANEVDATRRLSAADTALTEAAAHPSRSQDDIGDDNLASIQLRRDLEAARIEIETIERQRLAIKEVIANYEKKILQTPLVEREYLQLTRAYVDAREQYKHIRAKQITAQLGETLEEERKGERFSLIEPPSSPDKPVKPNRLMIVGLGFVLSVGGGLGTVILAEMVDSSVHGARAVARLTGSAPLVVVPYIRTRLEIRFAWAKRALMLGCASAAIAGTIAFVHYKVVSVDVLQARIERRIQTHLPSFVAEPDKR